MIGLKSKPRTFLFQCEDLQKECEELRELSNNRLQELDKLHMQHRDTLKEVEKLKMDVSVKKNKSIVLYFF